MIPRSRRIGGSSVTAKPIGDGQRLAQLHPIHFPRLTKGGSNSSLGSFLSPFISKPIIHEGKSSHPGIVTPPPSSPRSAPGLSVRGQPTSSANEDNLSAKATTETRDESPSLDVEIGGLYSALQATNPFDIIMNEKMDGGGGLLMDGNLLFLIVYLPLELDPNVLRQCRVWQNPTTTQLIRHRSPRAYKYFSSKAK